MRIWLPTAIVLSSATLAACSSTDGYVDEVNSIQQQVIEASNAVGSDVNASKGEILAQLETAEAETEEAVADLEGVDVPSEAEEGHAKLVAGFEDLEKLYADVVRRFESQSGGSAFDELRSKRVEIDKKIDGALDRINEDLGLEE